VADIRASAAQVERQQHLLGQVGETSGHRRAPDPARFDRVVRWVGWSGARERLPLPFRSALAQQHELAAALGGNGRQLSQQLGGEASDALTAQEGDVEWTRVDRYP